MRILILMYYSGPHVLVNIYEASTSHFLIDKTKNYYFPVPHFCDSSLQLNFFWAKNFKNIVLVADFKRFGSS